MYNPLYNAIIINTYENTIIIALSLGNWGELLKLRRFNIKKVINNTGEETNVRLIGADGQQIGIILLNQAIKLAEERDLDLVELDSEATPIVCKIMDYKKHIYDVKKQKSEAKKKGKRTQMKEIKFRPGTEEADYQVKIRKLVKFLKNGNKTKITMTFKGREITHHEIGLDLLKRVECDLSDVGTTEVRPTTRERQLTMIIVPKKK